MLREHRCIEAIKAVTSLQTELKVSEEEVADRVRKQLLNTPFPEPIHEEVEMSMSGIALLARPREIVMGVGASLSANLRCPDECEEDARSAEIFYLGRSHSRASMASGPNPDSHTVKMRFTEDNGTVDGAHSLARLWWGLSRIQRTSEPV